MYPTRSKKKKVRSTRRQTRPSHVELSNAEMTRSPSTRALRIFAQIAMLKRALLAAQDEGLPHKAICDYLHTLSQMAKLEPIAVTEDGDSELDDVPMAHGHTRQSANIRERLRQAIADIYGISELPGDDPATPPTNESSAESSK